MLLFWKLLQRHDSDLLNQLKISLTTLFGCSSALAGLEKLVEPHDNMQILLNSDLYRSDLRLS
jgi:hypothetical protein